MADLPRLIVVTGPPGAGKTTVAAALRARLGLPLIAKDALKETIGDALEFDGDRYETGTWSDDEACPAPACPGGRAAA